MTRRNVFLLLGLFWLAIIGGFVAYKELTLRTGTEILLRTVPVDPRDLFRGDYVILRYDISTVYVANADRDFRPGNPVHVVLAIEEGHAVAKDVLTKAPTDGLFLLGTVTEVDGVKLRVEYGIESYFVPEGEGHDIERYRGDRLDAKVVVGSSGRAVLKGLVLDGKDVDL
jgi:uncharacterized membrane-anchored protein